jgi:ArsR family transcriptional regulator
VTSFDICQYRRVSKSTLLAAGCCGLAAPPITEAAAKDLAPMFKALGDPVRLRLLSLIAAQPEVCVCDLSGAFAVTAPTVSHHLRVLREAGLVSAERRGTWVYYRLVPPAVARLGMLLSPGPATEAQL